MIQLVTVIISFLFIPILNRLKFKLSNTLLITAVILGLITGLGPLETTRSFIDVFVIKSSLSTVLTVMMVSIFGGLMKHYGILDQIVSSMISVINNKKNILMIIPAMIGVLLIPGGALLSAPFINNLGQDMKIPPVRRVAINLVFRHISMFILPYSTMLLLATSSFPDISMGKLILLNLIFVIFMIIMGYILYIKDIIPEKKNNNHFNLRDILQLLVYTSPIYICVIINMMTGLEFYITIIASIFIVYLLSDKKDFLKITIKSLNVSTVLTVIAILSMKETILKLDELLLIFSRLFAESNSMLAIMLVFLITSFFFGFITGSTGPSMAVTLPMLVQLNPSENMLYIYLYFCCATSFIGYFFSPLHLCQAFTLQHMEVSTGELYKEYRILAPMLVILLFISVFFLKVLFV